MNGVLERGMALEKNGDISSAISLYEESIRNGSTELLLFDRLVLLHRRQSDLQSEAKAIHKALEMFGDNKVVADEYSKRLLEIEKQ